MWCKEPWMINHGASLYFHPHWKEQSLKPFVQIKDHVLLPKAGEIERVDEEFRLITITQTSKVHPGFCEDPQETLQKLFDQLVL